MWMSFICRVCNLELTVPQGEECPQRPWSPYGRPHMFYDTEEKLFRIMVSGGTKYNKSSCKEGFAYGNDCQKAWAFFCEVEGLSPRAYKDAYITEMKDIKDVIFYLKPQVCFA